ncbi:hypothetical protein [Halalkalicoccus subterraneus]|nr:hypothetical protein [Halalkalicoccus subterraneus]
MWFLALGVGWLVAFVSVGGLLFAEGRRAERERLETTDIDPGDPI